jgi:hypothetical protein
MMPIHMAGAVLPGGSLDREGQPEEGPGRNQRHRIHRQAGPPLRFSLSKSPWCSLSNAHNHPEILKILFMSLRFQSKYLIDLNAIPYWHRTFEPSA